MATWWHLAAGEPSGPLDDGELMRLTASGALSPRSPVYRQGAADWVELATYETELGLHRNGWGSYAASPVHSPETGGVLTELAAP